MLRFGVLLTAVAASLLGVFALSQTGWFNPQPGRTESQARAKAANSSKLPARVQYRQGQLRHWRTCLLNQ
jgi:hypothetical protein